MRSMRNVAYYSKLVSKQTGIPRWKVHLVLMFAWNNIIKMLSRSEEIKLKNFGRIYFNKHPDAENVAAYLTREPGESTAQLPEPRKGLFDDQ